MSTINAAEVRHSGWSWRAEMTDRVVGSYCGAVNETNYFRFDGQWKAVSWDAIPSAAYRSLRKALRADVAKGPAA